MVSEYDLLVQGLNTKPEDVSLAQIARFRQSILESMENGKMTMSTGNKWLKQIAPKFDEDTKSLFEERNNKVIAAHWYGDDVEVVLTNKDAIAEAKMNLQNGLMILIDVEENKKGRRLLLSEVKTIVDDLKDNFRLRVNEDRGTYKVGEIRQFGDKLYRVTGFNEKGTPILDDDLSAPIKQEAKK